MTEQIHFVVSPVFELLAAMFRVHAHESLLDDKTREVAGKPVELSHWVEQKRAALPPTLKHDLDLFFNPESFFGLTLIRYAWENNAWKDISDFLEALERTQATNLFSYFLKSGYASDSQQPNVDHLEEVKMFIDTCNWPETEKWKATYLYIHAEDTKRKLIKLIQDFELYMKDEMAGLEEKKQASIQEMKEYLVHNGAKGLEDLLSSKLLIGDFEEIVIAPSVFYYDCSLISESGSSLIFLYGTKQFQLRSELAVDKDRIINAFKILSDEKRIHIIRLLQQSPLYGYELAQRLNLSNSTVSHHLSSLSSIGLVKAARKENRVYYEVQSMEIEKLLDQMKQTLTQHV